MTRGVLHDRYQGVHDQVSGEYHLGSTMGGRHVSDVRDVQHLMMGSCAKTGARAAARGGRAGGARGDGRGGRRRCLFRRRGR